MYKTFEIFLENVSFIVLLISMLIYWIQVSNLESFQFASVLLPCSAGIRREAIQQDSPCLPTGTYRPSQQGGDPLALPCWKAGCGSPGATAPDSFFLAANQKKGSRVLLLPCLFPSSKLLAGIRNRADVVPTNSGSLGATSAISLPLGVSCVMQGFHIKKKRNVNGHFLREILPPFCMEKQTKTNLAVRLSDKISFQSFPASIGILISNLSIFILLVLRWNESGHFPLSNLYESLMFLSWSLTFIHLVIEVIIFSGSKRPFFNLKPLVEEKTSFLTSLNTYSIPKGDIKTDLLSFLSLNVWLPKVRFLWDIRKIRESYDLERQSPQRGSVASAPEGLAIFSLLLLRRRRRSEENGKTQKRICSVPSSFSPCVLPIFSLLLLLHSCSLLLRRRSKKKIFFLAEQGEEYSARRRRSEEDGKQTKNKGGTSSVGVAPLRMSQSKKSPYNKKGSNLPFFPSYSCHGTSAWKEAGMGLSSFFSSGIFGEEEDLPEIRKKKDFFPSYSCSFGEGAGMGEEAKKHKKIKNTYPTPAGGCPIEYRGCAKPPRRKGVSFDPNGTFCRQDQQRKSATPSSLLLLPCFFSLPSYSCSFFSEGGEEAGKKEIRKKKDFFFASSPPAPSSPCSLRSKKKIFGEEDSARMKEEKEQKEQRAGIRRRFLPFGLRSRNKKQGSRSVKEGCCTFSGFELLLLPCSFSEGAGIRRSKKEKKKLINKLIGSITAPCALFTNAFATFSLPKEIQESSFLVPALQSNWLMMHVTVMILSYAALILGSLLSIGFLVITSVAGIGKLKTEKNINSRLSDPVGEGVSTKKKKDKRLNLAKTLDNLSYRMLGLGFPLLTIGILSGAVWANEAWGSYWSWDPKETWALLTWLVFAIYLHTRLTKGWQGTKPAIIASFGFITVWICFLGVNLIGEGLHSYGWVS